MHVASKEVSAMQRQGNCPSLAVSVCAALLQGTSLLSYRGVIVLGQNEGEEHIPGPPFLHPVSLLFHFFKMMKLLSWGM